MPQLVTNTAKLTSKASRSKQSLATALYFEPEPYAAINPATLVLVVEVRGHGDEMKNIIEIMQDCFGERYYQQSSNSDGEVNHFELFEGAIRDCNVALKQYSRSSSGSWVGKVNAVAAALCQNELLITHAGSGQASLYRGNSVTDITQPEEAAEPGSGVFSEIISGPLRAGDKLLITTPALMHHFSTSVLDELISDNSPASAIQKIASQLRGTDSSRISALIIEVNTADAMAMGDITHGNLHEIELSFTESLSHQIKEKALPVIKRGKALSIRASKQSLHIIKTKLAPKLAEQGRKAFSSSLSALKTTISRAKAVRKR